MLVKSNPYTPAKRNKVFIAKDKDIYDGPPKKELTVGVKRSCGINNQGRKTVAHRGGAKQRRVLRLVDFNRRSKFDMNAIVERLESDPHRSSYIALLKYENNTYSYIIATGKMKKGDFVSCSLNKLEIQEGNRMPLKHIPQDVEIHNVELQPERRARIATSAGTSIKIVGFNDGKVKVRFPSGEQREISEDSLATIGIVSKAQHKNIKGGGAGERRRKGFRPVVRAMAKNPVDHPHGGGGGKRLGRRKCNPKGVPIGTRTRSIKKPRLNKSLSKR